MASPGACSAFLSHYQATGQLQATTLREALASRDHACFFDQDATILNKDVMLKGVADASLYCLLLTRDVLTRRFVRMEAARAVALDKPICFLLDTDAARGGAPLQVTLEEAAKAVALAGEAPAAPAAPGMPELDAAGLATLIARAGPPIPFGRGAALHCVTLPALLARIAAASAGRAAGSAASDAAAPALYPALALRRPKLHTVLPRLGGGGACCGAACGVATCALMHNERAHLLIVGAEEATDQAEFLSLVAKARCRLTAEEPAGGSTGAQEPAQRVPELQVQVRR